MTTATVLFLQPARAARAKRALRMALGGEKFEVFIGFLTFIRAAHYWTLMHPELELEHDVQALLKEHEELARLLSEDPEAGRCEMGTRLFEELEALRDLNERQELETAKRALEESGRQKDLLIKEVDHRVKNSLQVVSSLLLLQARRAGAAAGQFHDAAARVAAIATVHQQLYKFDKIGTVALDHFLGDLCQAIGTASSSSYLPCSLSVEADPLVISTDMAMPLALIVNELITNAIKHSQPAARGGRVQILLKSAPDNFSISVRDAGEGPAANPTSGLDTLPAGLGTGLVESLARQIDATITRGRVPAGYAVMVTVPHSRSARQGET